MPYVIALIAAGCLLYGFMCRWLDRAEETVSDEEPVVEPVVEPASHAPTTHTEQPLDEFAYPQEHIEKRLDYFERHLS